MIIASPVSPLPSIPYTGNATHGGATTSVRIARGLNAEAAGQAEPGQAAAGQPARPAGAAEADRVGQSEAASKPRNNGLAEEFSPQELRILDQLKQTDLEVRQHELAHQVAGGAYTGGAQFQYEIGPDGQRYAVAGEVSVDYGPVTGDPRATIEKMNVVISAALAPAEPSPTDYQVAARARQYLLTAQLELSQQQTDAANLAAKGAAANDDETAAVELGRDLRVDEYSRIATTTGVSANDGQTTLHSVA